MMKTLVAACLLAASTQTIAQEIETVPPAAVSIDPSRLAAAKIATGYLIPDGTYARIMNSSLEGMMKPLLGSMDEISIRDLAKIGGVPEEQLANVGTGNLADIMAILDPVYHQRTQLSMKVVMGEIVSLMTKFEPIFRDGLADAYARQFTSAQLNDINAFFATPTGQIYARESMPIAASPEVMTKMQELFPSIMQAMPAIIQKTKEATASLPAPRTYEQLSEAEKMRFNALVGLENPKAKPRRKRA